MFSVIQVFQGNKEWYWTQKDPTYFFFFFYHLHSTCKHMARLALPLNFCLVSLPVVKHTFSFLLYNKSKIPLKSLRKKCLWSNFSVSIMWLYVFRVTIMKDKDTRKSKGVAFILFLDKESAQNCSRALNNKQVNCGKLL